MSFRIIILITILSMAISASVEEPTFNCQREKKLFFSPDRYYTSNVKQDCSFVNINSIEEFKETLLATGLIPRSIASLSFNNSNISQFPERMFSSYTSLKTLDGSNLRLGTISSSTFDGALSLETINLSFNLLMSLTSKVFANRKVKILNLSNNMIATIDDSAFLGSEIDDLNLSFNKIKVLSFVNGFKYFGTLQMNNNEIEQFSDVKLSISNWIGVRENVFGTVYPTINLEANKLQTFECKSSIRFILIEIKNNADLKSVDMGECLINELDVSNCEKLKSITLGKNLERFTAKNVKFDKIDFSNAESLDSLKLVNNSLSADNIDDIMKLENLTSLDLSYNSIGPLNISTFSKLKQLTSLTLKSTSISNIQFGTFSHQGSVRMLDMSDNNLGSFDMQMIFSMTSLTSLDLSGNNLIELSNIEAAHTTFALLEKIDFTKNSWTCSYLLRLIKIMRAYRVKLEQSNVEENNSNIHGIYCRHIAGEDNVIEPLSPESYNISDVRDKMNEIVGRLTKETQFRNSLEARLSTLENRLDNTMTSNQALHLSAASNDSQRIQVQNSALLEMTLIIAFVCFIVLVSLKIVSFVRRNILGYRERPIRVGLSEHTLTMNTDDY